jgi:hypothetical protein
MADNISHPLSHTTVSPRYNHDTLEVLRWMKTYQSP